MPFDAKYFNYPCFLKANQREESYKEQIKTLTTKLKQVRERENPGDTLVKRRNDCAGFKNLQNIKKDLN